MKICSWLVCYKWHDQKLESTLFSDDYIIFGDLDSDFLLFFTEYFDLDAEHFDYCDLETINHVRLMGWYNKYKKRKPFKNRTVIS